MDKANGMFIYIKWSYVLDSRKEKLAWIHQKFFSFYYREGNNSLVLSVPITFPDLLSSDLLVTRTTMNFFIASTSWQFYLPPCDNTLDVCLTTVLPSAMPPRAGTVSFKYKCIAMPGTELYTVHAHWITSKNPRFIKSNSLSQVKSASKKNIVFLSYSLTGGRLSSHSSC